MAIVELVEEKITTKRSKLKKERLKKIMEFIEKKKSEYGLIKETSSQKETKEEVSKSEEKTESE